MFLFLVCLLNGVILHSSMVLALDSCGALPPCTCSGIGIYCADKNLTYIPNFHKTTTIYGDVYLYRNDITRVEAGTFSNLSGADSLDLWLSNNSINYIDDGAFIGLESTRLALHLENNNLTVLPRALTRLDNLTALKISGIHSLDPHIMALIGLSLESLDIDMKRLTAWPDEVKYLLKLNSLTVRNMRFAHIPENVFETFQTPLQSLSMHSSNQSTVAICFLNRVTTLKLINLDVPYSELIPNCTTPLTSVEFLSIVSNTLRSFPNVFTAFPAVTEIFIESPLQYMDDSVIPDNNVVTDLKIHKSRLQTVPAAIHKFKTIRRLSLPKNEIISIEANAFRDLPLLVSLDIYHNPIVFMSEQAFGNSSNIRTLILEHVNLKYLPRALLHLHKLLHLYTRGTPFECSCDLEWLLTWNRLDSVRILGNCHPSKEPISDFVKTKLRLCNPAPIG